MESAIITPIVGVICTTIASIVTFILTKRKYNIEVDSQQIHNMSESFNVYKKMMEETLSSQKTLMEETIDRQNKKIESLQKENDSLKQQVSELQMQLIRFLGQKLHEEERANRG